MKTKKFSRFIAILISIILINLVAPIPSVHVSASSILEDKVAQRLNLTSSELANFKNNYDFHELTGKALSTYFIKAQNNNRVKAAISYIQSNGYVLLEGSIFGEEVYVGSGVNKRVLALLLWDYLNVDESIARIIFISDSYGDVKVGFGLIEQQVEFRTVRSYQVLDNNEFVDEPLLEIYDDGTIQTYQNGQKNVLNQACDQTAQVSENCLTCINVCNALYSLGCGLSGIIACTLICAPIGGLACPIICGAVYLVLCVIGGGSCSTVCGPMLGYCP